MTVEIICADAREGLARFPDGHFHCCVTSPPFWGLRDYGLGPDALGLEPTPELYVEHLVSVMREVRRVLRDDGTLWLNLGDSYYNYRPGAGSRLGKQTIANHEGAVVEAVPRRANVMDGLKEKDLVGIPWMVAFALRADGWWLRSDIVWSKPNPMPESVRDRPTRSHEYLFLLTKRERYYYDQDAIREPYNEGSLGRYQYEFGHGPAAALAKSPAVGDGAGHSADPNPAGRNRRSVWEIPTQPYPGAHFATFPEKLVEPCILAGCPEGGTVLDPFAGSGTVGVVAERLGRRSVLIDAKPEYVEMVRHRTAQRGLMAEAAP